MKIERLKTNLDFEVDDKTQPIIDPAFKDAVDDHKEVLDKRDNLEKEDEKKIQDLEKLNGDEPKNYDSSLDIKTDELKEDLDARPWTSKLFAKMDQLGMTWCEWFERLVNYLPDDKVQEFYEDEFQAFIEDEDDLDENLKKDNLTEATDPEKIADVAEFAKKVFDVPGDQKEVVDLSNEDELEDIADEIKDEPVEPVENIEANDDTPAVVDEEENVEEPSIELSPEAQAILDKIDEAGKREEYESLLKELYPEGVDNQVIEDLLVNNTDWFFTMLDM